MLFYLLGLLLIVFPLMLLEFAIGRRGRADAVGSIAAVASASGASRIWAVVGIAGVVGAIRVMPAHILAAELRLGASANRIIVVLLRYVAPVAIVAVSLLPIGA